MPSGSWGWRPRWRARRLSAPSRSCRREPRWPRSRMRRGRSRPGVSCAGCCAAPGTPWRRLRRRPATRTWRPGSPRTRWPMTRSTRARTVFSCPPARRPGLADRILRQTRGHTLFVVEVLRALAEGDSGLPESLRSTVQARVRRLGPEAEHLLRVAAVLGAAIDPVTVAAVADVPPAAALQLCELALRARRLVAAGRDFEFANDLIREALYATTPEPTRLAYHQRAADRLTSQPESLARHAAACGDWLRAARALLSAADEAFRRFAVTDSAALATQALEAAERAGDLEVAARARVIRGRAHEGVAAVSSALADFSAGAAAARAAGDQRLEMLALRHLGGDAPVAHGMPTGYCESHLARGPAAGGTARRPGGRGGPARAPGHHRDQHAAIRTCAGVRAARCGRGPGGRRRPGAGRGPGRAQDRSCLPRPRRPAGQCARRARAAAPSPG